MEHEEEHRERKEVGGIVEKKEEIPNKKGKLTEKMRENPWILSTLVLGVVTLILFISNFSGGMAGGVISKEQAGDALLDFANQQGADAELVGVEDAGNFYEVTLAMDGRDVPLMVTKDGEYFLSGGLVPLDDGAAPSQQTDSQDDIPKSDNPEVELFIWSYCPYGVQAQGPLAEVASLLGSYANFKVVLYYDGHGAYETQQNKIQACIQEVDKEKYWDYAAGFVENIYPKCGTSRDIDCDKTESIDLMKSLGIDSSKVMSCVDSRGESLIGEDSQRAKQLGVTGSPSLIINGVKSNAGRTAEAYKAAVCYAFNDSPEECSIVLDESAVAASGNC